MLRIRAEQMDVFADARRAILARDLGDHLRAHHAELLNDLPEPVIAARLEHVVRLGERLGLTRTRAFAYLAALMFRFGPGVPVAADIKRVVRSAKDRDRQMARLPGLLDVEAWRRVARDAATAWPQSS